MDVKPYAKAAVAVAFAAITALYATITDGVISGDEWKVIAGEALAAFLVWLVPNRPTVDVPPPTAPRWPGME